MPNIMGGLDLREISESELEIARYFAESLIKGLDLPDELQVDIRKIPGNGIEFSISRKAYFFSADFGILMTKIASMINDIHNESDQ